MRKLILMAAGLVLMPAVFLGGAQIPDVENETGEIVIFDADKSGSGVFANDTCAWLKGSDYRPKTELTGYGDGKWLEFSYTGVSGQARSNIDCSQIVSGQVQAGLKIGGIKAVIDYNDDDMGKLDFLGHTQSGLFSSTQTLQKGTREYIFKGGFAQQKPDWNLLTVFGIWNRPEKAYCKSFRLKKVSLLVGDGFAKAKELKIDFIRPVKEVLFSESPLTAGGDFTPAYDWDKLSATDVNPDGMAKSPVKLNIGFDNNTLFLCVSADFPSKPQANVRQNDMEVWQDEALELFFSGDYNNDRKIQFVINSNGVVMDYLRDFDVAAASVIDNYKWDLPHKKHLSYADGKMIYRLAFRLKDLQVNSASKPFVGFDMVQNYARTATDKLYTVKWGRIGNNPNPYNFGFLVLNRKTFGPGTVNAGKVSLTPRDFAECDLSVKVEIADFADSVYSTTQWLAQPDCSVLERKEEITVGGRKDLVFYLPHAKNLNGTYAWILGLKNRAGDTKLFAINFKNETDMIDLSGTELIWPRPKKAEWSGKGVFKAGEKHFLSIPENASGRMQRTAELFQEKLSGYAGSEYKVVKGGNSDIILKISSEVIFNGKTEILRPEGYHLKVTPDKVEITGSDEPGLFYGTITFMQMLKSPMKRLDAAPVKCAEILDWPDLSRRLAKVWPPDQIGNKVEEKTTLENMLALIDRFIAENKFNLFSVYVDSLTIFERRPEVNFNLANRAFTLKDWGKISEFCKSRFIKLIPALPAGGHDYWLTMARPEFREKGWRVMANVAHPDYFPTYRDCALDIIEASGCKYFSPNLDEWWHDRMNGEEPDKLLYGKPRDQVLLDFLLQLHQFLKEHDVKLVIWEDMLNPMHNGRRYEVYKIIDSLPKDIIIAPWAWAGGIPACSEYFYNRGFSELWGSCTSFTPVKDQKTKHLYSGFGTTLFGSFGNGIQPNASESEQAVFQWTASWFRGADYAWNFYQGNECSVSDEISSGVFPALSGLFALNPNPCASQEIKTMDISNSLNASLSAVMKKQWPDAYKNEEAIKLPEGETAIGFIPVKLGTSDKNCVIIDQNNKVDFNVKGKFSSLIFLHSILDPKDMKTELKGVEGWRTWHMGWPSGSYIIEYRDGSNAKFPIHFGQDIYWLKKRAIGGATVYNRYIWHHKDSAGAYLFIFQSEWDNPFPDKEIVKVTFQDEPRIPLKTAIFAISGRAMKKTTSEIK